jgi:hypothetical protein
LDLTEYNNVHIMPRFLGGGGRMITGAQAADLIEISRAAAYKAIEKDGPSSVAIGKSS